MPRRRAADARELVGPLEYRILQVMWRQSSATVGDVLAAINDGREPELAYTTVMTVLSRLHDKELVLRERDGRGYRYVVRHTEDELVRTLASREVDRIVERFGDVALAKFAHKLDGADPELLERLRSLAAEDSAG